jgi:hypothetical protein
MCLAKGGANAALGAPDFSDVIGIHVKRDAFPFYMIFLQRRLWAEMG